MERTASKESQVQWVLRAKWEKWVCLVLLENRAQWVQQDSKETSACQARKETKARQDPKVSRVPQDQREHQDRLGRQD